jgi:hypothetical protein
MNTDSPRRVRSPPGVPAAAGGPWDGGPGVAPSWATGRPAEARSTAHAGLARQPARNGQALRERRRRQVEVCWWISIVFAGFTPKLNK